MNRVEDPLWPHFQPLWSDLRSAGVESLCIAGGYGLFLKQNWLTTNTDTQIVVPTDQWRTVGPRVTKDVDLVLGLDLIAKEEHHQQILKALRENSFEIGDKPSDQRWKYKKQLEGDQFVILELHAPKPSESHLNLTHTNMRVKHKPSLGETGIHGRTNPEASGAEHQPFVFENKGVSVAVVNPVTWSVMKLTAMRDRWNRSQDQNEAEEYRTFSQNQAIKHAQDVFRIIALVTRYERDAASEVATALHDEPTFMSAADIWRDDFATERPGLLAIREQWDDRDIEVIQGVLGSWFSGRA